MDTDASHSRPMPNSHAKNPDQNTAKHMCIQNDDICPNGASHNGRQEADTSSGHPMSFKAGHLQSEKRPIGRSCSVISDTSSPSPDHGPMLIKSINDSSCHAPGVDRGPSTIRAQTKCTNIEVVIPIRRKVGDNVSSAKRTRRDREITHN